MTDRITEQDVIEVNSLTEDKELISQVEKSREDRRYGRIYTGEHGLEYLRSKAKEF